MVEHLRKKETIEVAKTTLQVVTVTCLKGQTNTFGLSMPRLPQDMNIRVLLAAFLSTLFPHKIYQSIGEKEILVMDTSKTFLDSLRAIIAIACAAKDSFNFNMLPFQMLYTFPTQVCCYIHAFQNWKSQDTPELFSKVKHALLQLYNTKFHHPPSVDSTGNPDTITRELRSQISRLRGKFVELSGVQKLVEFDNDYHAGKFDGEQTAKPLHYHFDNIRHNKNEFLAHQLIVCPGFQMTHENLDDMEPAENHRLVRKSFNEAYYNLLLDEITGPSPNYARPTMLLIEFRRCLIDVCPATAEEEICKVLPWKKATVPHSASDEPEKQESEVRSTFATAEGGLALLNGVASIIDKHVSKKSAPVFVEKWASIKQSLDETYNNVAIVQALRCFMDTIRDMQLDNGNAQ